jgi:hypothetical protein
MRWRMSGLSRKNTAVNFCFHPLCSLARGPLVRSWGLYQAIAAGAFSEVDINQRYLARELREKRRQDFLSPQMGRLRHSESRPLPKSSKFRRRSWHSL